MDVIKSLLTIVTCENLLTKDFLGLIIDLIIYFKLSININILFRLD